MRLPKLVSGLIYEGKARSADRARAVNFCEAKHKPQAA